MEDMHIHLKEGIFDQDIFDSYIKKCISMGLNKVVFLDHGNRISPKHKAVLDNEEAVDMLTSKINNDKSGLAILKGIEIDYSKDPDFRRETLRILNYGNFDWVVGAIHSLKFDSLREYLLCVQDMILNYNINVIAHMIKSNEYKENEELLINILELCNKKGIAIEINTSDRSRWDDELLYYFLRMMKLYDVSYVIGSDAHCVDDVGYKIKEIEEKILVWKKGE